MANMSSSAFHDQNTTRSSLHQAGPLL